MRTGTLAIMLLACWACDADGRKPKSDPSGFDRDRLTSSAARARGRALYQQHCALCHGVRADGHGVRQRGLVGKPVDFSSQGWRRSVDPETVFAAIRDGKTGTSMASWKLLGNDAVADLTSYVLSVSAEGP